MGWVKPILSEVYGLFVDDGSFAVVIVVWLAIAGAVLPRLPIPGSVKAPILFAGLLLILLESTLRRSG